MSYKFPIERPLPVNAFDLCDGPFVLGSTQTPQYTDRWAAWVGSATIRLGKWVAGMVMDDTNGQIDDLFFDLGPELSPGGNWSGSPFEGETVNVELGATYKFSVGIHEQTLINLDDAYASGASGQFVAKDVIVSVGRKNSAAGLSRTYSLKKLNYIRPSKLSLCFEQSALPVIAIQKDPATIEIRRKVSGTVNSYVFSGLSPVLFYNGVAIIDTTVTDAICLYVKVAGDKIFARAQRDNFAIEYTINATIAPGAVIKELRKTDRRNIAGVNYQALWGVAQDGRQLYFRTAPYPPLPQYVTEKVTSNVALDASTYALGVLSSPIVRDKVTEDTTFDSGIYFSVVAAGPAPADKVTGDVALDSGVYALGVVAGPAPTDKATVDATFDSGIYFLQAVVSTTPTDKVTTDTGLDSGIYA